MMKANEILNEAGIIDKLKGAFRKKPAPAQIIPPKSSVKPAVDFEQPAYLRKQAAAAAAAAPKPTLPKMKVKKTDPRTALGMKVKGGSPEYKTAQANIKKSVKPTVQTQPKQKPVQPAAQSQTPVANIKQADFDQRNMAKSIGIVMSQMTDQKILKDLQNILQARLKTLTP